MNEIATTATRAAVQAMSNTPVSTASRDEARQNQDQPQVADATSSILHNNDIATRQQPMPTQTNTNCLPYGHSFHDVPASYIKQIQTGEFFELSKLLPKNLFATTNEQPVSLTLENSTLKVKTSTQSVTNITDIEQWTTAFTTYMSVFTHEFHIIFGGGGGGGGGGLCLWGIHILCICGEGVLPKVTLYPID